MHPHVLRAQEIRERELEEAAAKHPWLNLLLIIGGAIFMTCFTVSTFRSQGWMVFIPPFAIIVFFGVAALVHIAEMAVVALLLWLTERLSPNRAHEWGEWAAGSVRFCTGWGMCVGFLLGIVLRILLWWK
jgi:hypothetical protein